MAPSSASVFVIDKWLFWGFNNDRNDIVAITFFVEKVETDLVNVWTPQELCKACRNYVNFVSVCYLVPGIGLQRLENDRDVLYMCQIGLADPEKEVHVNLENSDLEGGPVSDIGPVIEVHAMPINCNAENVVEAVVE
ncbi:hypothetical protein GmHk_15G042833 [Glycine max]|nr:hypothetical protein GmHk_15G042833 [Glycine max]